MMKRKTIKYVAVFTTLAIINEVVFPTVAFALTSGPTSPEFSSFEPVATTSMVNEFSGDFTYNIPVLNIPGANGGEYALSLSYHSGESVESEASWVGYGWTLNPGSITRSKRGFADDISNGDIKYYNDMPANWTGTIGFHAGNLEAFSYDLPIQFNGSIRYNNYKGFGTSVGAGLSIARGLVSLGFSVSDGDATFSPKINVGAALSYFDKPDANAPKKMSKEEYKKLSSSEKMKVFTTFRNEMKNYNKNKSKEKGAKTKKILSSSLNNFGSYVGSDAYSTTVIKPYSGFSINLNLSAEIVPAFVPVGFEAGLYGSFTRQKNDEYYQTQYCGYMYSSEVNDEETVMDYFTEKDYPFNKRNRYLGIPFSNADMYSVSGEGVGGSFRVYNKNTGTFRVNEVKNTISIFQLGLEGQTGTNLGLGADFSVGWQRLKTNGNWTNNGNQSDFAFRDKENEGVFFRFANDLGGNVVYGETTAPERAYLKKECGVSGFKSYSPHSNTAVRYLKSNIENGSVNRSGRSSYIGYNTISEVKQQIENKYYRAYDKRNAPNADETTHPERIQEFAITKNDGNQYVYGLPVMAKEETTQQLGLTGCEPDVYYHKTAYPKNLGFKTRIGEKISDEYATSYLLTQITTPDYLDRNSNGPDDEDFGGYVKFSYKKMTNDQNWYKWRMPYNGLSFNDNQLSVLSDNTGTMSAGYKEIFYLDRIETKTHFARFITEDRKDGLDADHNESNAIKDSSSKGDFKLQALKRIELYAKNGNDSALVQTVYFEYTYSAYPGLPNSMQNCGKLTLDRIWFEYNGVVNAKTSPYVFGYTYPDVDYPSQYDSFEQYNVVNGTAINETPSYDPNFTDRWGNYECNGRNRNDSLIPWVDQTPPTTFDPAAWQLKTITLPSGGQIHIQYEQDDYLYVQDRRAMEMVSLLEHHGDTAFSINVNSDLGIISNSDKQKLVDLINYTYADKKMYFKFLYTMSGNDPTYSLATISNMEYIDGYVSIDKARLDGGQIWIRLRDGDQHLPVEVCQDFVKHERGNSINDANAIYDEVTDENDKDGSLSLINQIAGVFSSAADVFKSSCKALNSSMSYFRIPCLFPKKGGGLRVKRILMYDGGLEEEDDALFGTEYLYINEDGSSSGVATNEPSEGREENALVDLMITKDDQTLMQKLIAGTDKEQLEGPIGESLLPGPSVGYSRVISKNIHSGNSSPGFIVNEFYTYKDFPFDKKIPLSNSEYNGLMSSNTPISEETDILPGNTGLFNYNVNNIWATQGYRFICYNIHGSPKSVTTYAGSYNDFENCIETSRQQYEYFEPGEKIPMMYGIGDIREEYPGKESEIVMEIRSVSDITNDLNIEGDASVALFLIPIPFVSAMPSYTYSESKLFTHVTTKVISYPVVLKKIIVSQDGITQTSEYLAFDPNTGNPVVTKTYDGFNGLNLSESTNHEGFYLNYGIPAAFYYPQMGQKAINERSVISASSNLTISFSNNRISFTTASGGCVCEITKMMTKGDLLLISDNSSNKGLCHVIDKNGSDIIVDAAYSSTLPSSISRIEVIRSGRTNQLGASATSIVTYGIPLVTSSSLSQHELTERQSFVNTLNAHKQDAQYMFSSDIIAFQGKEFMSCDSPAKITMQYSNNLLTVFVDDNCSTGLCGSGSFVLDQNTGKIFWIVSGCKQEIPCFVFCNSDFNLQKVISANATTYSDEWYFSENEFNYEPFSGNQYEKGKRGKWRPKYSYVYKEAIVGGAKANERNYKDAGVFNFRLFDFALIDNNDITKWIRTSEITKYSPDGNPIEEKNILNIYSCAKMGYLNTLVYLMAQNAKYSQAQFESFENSYTIALQGVFEDRNYLNDISNKTDGASHSGRYSYLLSSSGNEFAFKPINKENSLDGGVSVKVWVRDDSYSDNPVKLKMKYNTTSYNFSFKRIARVGEWALYEAVVPESSLSSNYYMTFSIVSNVASSIFIDDARLQPTKAQVSCYVYDVATKKLLTSFDDQHFGLFYQYNAEGKLIRKKVETVNGIKTIQETHYNTPAYRQREVTQ